MAEVKLAEALAVLDVLKAPGPGCLTNAEKYLAGQAAREASPRVRPADVCATPSIAKSTYEDQAARLSRPDPKAALRARARASFEASGGAYGPEGVTADIRSGEGEPVSWRDLAEGDMTTPVAASGRVVRAVRPTADWPLALHGDGGAVYMGADWARACEAGHITRSMSRKARSPDNARCEGFFGTLKSDFFAGRDWSGVTFEEFSRRLEHIERYRSVKVKKALGWKTIRQRRVELGYTA